MEIHCGDKAKNIWDIWVSIEPLLFTWADLKII